MENVTKVIQLIPLNYYILLSTLLFSIGVIGVLSHNDLQEHRIGGY